MDQQVLIHIAAPGRLHHDRKYQRLADELARFEVAAVTRVYGFVGLASKRNDSRACSEANLSFYKTTTTLPAMMQRPPRPGQVANESRLEILSPSSKTRRTRLATKDIMEPASTFSISDSHSDVGSPDSIVRETPLQRRGRTVASRSDNGGKPRVRRLGQWPVDTGQAARTRVFTCKPMNPQYRNPFHGKSPSGAAIRTLQTPVLSRPRTAPAGSNGAMLVPRTESVTHKRSASDSFLDTSFSSGSTVPDSQFSTRRVIDQVLDSQGPPGRQRAATAPPNTFAAIDVTPDLQPHKRRRLTTTINGDVAMKDTAEAGSVSPSPVDGSFERKFLVRRPAAYEGPYFLRDRSEDWTSPPEPSTSDPSSTAVSSTLSPSQPLALRLSQTRNSPTFAQPSLQINLVYSSPIEACANYRKTAMGRTSSLILPRTTSSPCLPSDPFESSPGFATRSFYDGSLRVPPSTRGHSGRFTGSPSTRSSKGYDLTSSIRSLPDNIQAPLPQVGSGLFTTHISRDLSIMVTRLPLTKYFRPNYVVRDVRVLERGFWSIRVKVACDKDVAEARRPYNQRELLAALNRQMSGASSEERAARYDKWKASGSEASELGLSKCQDLWTEAEFLDFWEVLKRYVEAGKAGHQLSVAKDWAEKAVMPGRSTQSTYARIRVYTWGEVVGHMWIALWVLSDKKTAYVPMEWIAADDSVVVKMSGERHRAGKLGPWVPKGSPGGKGSWGVEAGTPPGNQGKYVCFPNS